MSEIPKYPDARPEMQEMYKDKWKALHTKPKPAEPQGDAPPRLCLQPDPLAVLSIKFAPRPAPDSAATKEQRAMMKFCESSFAVENGVIRCQLEHGHAGDHSVSWDWEDIPLVEIPEETPPMPHHAAGQPGKIEWGEEPK